jgi:hypothetical protein
VFRGLIDDAKSAVGDVVARYATRAAIGVVFAVAIGFAVSAIVMQLVDRFGAIPALWMIAGGFAVIGIVAVVLEGLREKQQDTADKEAEKHDTEQVAGSAASEAAMQLPIALLGSLLSGPAGPISALSIMRFLGRNLPLVVLMIGIGMLVWPTGPVSGDSTGQDEAAA